MFSRASRRAGARLALVARVPASSSSSAAASTAPWRSMAYFQSSWNQGSQQGNQQQGGSQQGGGGGGGGGGGSYKTRSSASVVLGTPSEEGDIITSLQFGAPQFHKRGGWVNVKRPGRAVFSFGRFLNGTYSFGRDTQISLRPRTLAEFRATGSVSFDNAGFGESATPTKFSWVMQQDGSSQLDASIGEESFSAVLSAGDTYLATAMIDGVLTELTGVTAALRAETASAVRDARNQGDYGSGGYRQTGGGGYSGASNSSYQPYQQQQQQQQYQTTGNHSGFGAEQLP